MHNEQQDGFQDVRFTNVQYNRIIVVEYIQVFFALFGMTFSIVLNELRLNQEISLDNEYIVLCYIAFSNLALAITAYFRYDQYLKWYVKRGLLTQYDTLGSTGWWKAIVIEQFIALIAPFPFFQGIKYVEDNPNWKVTISYEMN